MKKIFMLALVLTTLAVSAFADNTKTIHQKALSSFAKTFENAKEVSWETRNNLYKATFKINGKKMFAYYNQEGEQVAVSRNIHPDQLPLSLSMNLKEKYEHNWLTDLFEVSANGETSYYATVESATHVTIYKAIGATDWAVFKKDRKK